MNIEIKSSTISIGIIVVLVGIIGVLMFQQYGQPKASITGNSVSSGNYEGFSSYEEMMEAHHGSGAAAQGGGCSGVSVTNGEMSEYGISYDQSGFERLLEYNSEISLSEEQAKSVIGLDVRIDCCGFDKIQASGNCACGHHLALYGLAKFLAGEGHDRDYIQGEIDKWKDIYAQSDIGGCG